MADRLSITRHIAATPEQVYAAISDITRMGEWSEECHTCEWTGDSSAPELGATFDGHNRAGDNEWTTQCTIVDAEPGRSFAFECRMLDFHFSTWGYAIEATDSGSRVTEWTENLLPEELRPTSVQISGIEDREGRNRSTMTGTLDRLAAALEAGPA